LCKVFYPSLRARHHLGARTGPPMPGKPGVSVADRRPVLRPPPAPRARARRRS
jgi:hypothetical protein